MLKKSSIEKLIRTLRTDSRRALKMKVRGFPRPYYVSFLLRDTCWFNTWASSGSTVRQRSDHTRNVYCDLRVGTYRYDQITEGGLNDNDEDNESYQHVTVPIDDKDLGGLRMCLWRLTESKYREAISDFSNKKTARISTIDPFRKLRSFEKYEKLNAKKYPRNEKVDELKWSLFCKRASKWMSKLSGVTGNYVEFDANQVIKIFVSTENRIIVQSEKIFSLNASIRNLTQEGLQLEQELALHCNSQKELPSFKKFKSIMTAKHKVLKKLIKAKTIHSFSGPALLCPKPAGLLFHEALGHRLEGSRLLSTTEGQTFKGQIGKKILNTPIDIYDNPNLKKFNGQSCIGSYDYDDEGAPAKKAMLVKDGFLDGFLSTRAQLPAKGYLNNGHARNAKWQRPISRMGVTIIESKKPHSFEALKELLIKTIKKQKKPFGVIVYETVGGETETDSYDFQVFSGQISHAILVFSDGTEKPIKGVDFVGTPLQALNNIIAAGDTQELDNHYCGAESGFIPVSTISPAVLLSNLELQSRPEDLVTQYILPKPKL